MVSTMGKLPYKGVVSTRESYPYKGVVSTMGKLPIQRRRQYYGKVTHTKASSLLRESYPLKDLVSAYGGLLVQRCGQCLGKVSSELSWSYIVDKGNNCWCKTDVLNRFVVNF